MALSEKEKYNWNLEDLLKGKTIDDLYKEWIKKLNVLIDKYDSHLDDVESFVKYKKHEEEFSIISNRLGNYISNNAAEDTVNPEWIKWNQKLTFDIQPLLIKTSNEDNLILKNKQKVRKFLEDKRLKEYRRGYEILFSKAKHILSEKEEMLLTKLSKLSGSYEEIYSAVTDATIKFNDVCDSKGKNHKIGSMAEVFKLLKSKDALLRKNAWIEFNKQYYDNRYTLTQTLYYNYLDLNESAKIRKYQNYIDAVCDSDEVNLEFVNLIYKGVEQFSKEYKKFYTLRTKLISHNYGIKKPEPWDKSLDVVSLKSKYTIPEIQKTLLDVFKIFGDEYVETLQRAFDERWISWLPKPNKHSGAYSIGGTQGLDKYYISMNYDSTINSLFTAAHELGHSMHSYYFGKKQTIHCSCSIFYAEIASITNEVILSLYLLGRVKTDKEKLFILDEMITGFFSTTTRQIIFSNFEYEMINKLENNEPITYESIFETYQKMISKYSDTTKRINPNKKPYNLSLATILRIDHFYMGNFYVYKYAIGQICAMYIANKIWKGDQEAIQRYFKFLESGSSLSPIDTTKLLGIDFKDDEIWQECRDILEDLINKYKKIANKIMKS